jgi:hypothetical protein
MSNVQKVDDGVGLSDSHGDMQVDLDAASSPALLAIGASGSARRATSQPGSRGRIQSFSPAWLVDRQVLETEAGCLDLGHLLVEVLALEVVADGGTVFLWSSESVLSPAGPAKRA